MPTLIDKISAPYDSVRKLIDVTFVDKDLPDAVLDLPIYKDAAVTYVSCRTGNGAADTPADKLAQVAVYYYMAYLAVPSITQMLNESNAGYSYQVKSRNWDNLAEELLERTDRAIADSERLNPTDVGDAWEADATITQFDSAPAWPWWRPVC